MCREGRPLVVARSRVEGCQEIIWKWFEERIGDFKLASGQADRPQLGSLRLNGVQFGDRPVASADHENFAFLDSIKVARKICFGIVNIETGHDSTIHYVVD